MLIYFPDMRRFRPAPDDPAAIYRVSGGVVRQKSDSGIQTEAASAIMVDRQQQQQQQQQQLVDWKKAMAHSARVLSSQERAMDEYLRRQRAAAEHHIQQANNQIILRQQQQNIQHQQAYLPQSVPATPTGTRRSENVRSANPHQQQQHHSNSLERRNGRSVSPSVNHHVQHPPNYNNGAFSDSEYGRMAMASPVSSRNVYQQQQQQLMQQQQQQQQQSPVPPGSPGN